MLSPEEVKKLTSPYLEQQVRKNYFFEVCQKYNLNLEQLTNVLIFEHGIPIYLMELFLSGKGFIDKYRKEKEEKPLVVNETLLKEPDYSWISKVFITDRDEEYDDIDEFKEDFLSDIKEFTYHKELNVGDLINFGPVNNDLGVEVKSYCHQKYDEFSPYIHGLFTCKCVVEGELAKKCFHCDKKIGKLFYRIPLENAGGWYNGVYCSEDCLQMKPVVDLSPKIQLKLTIAFDIYNNI